jgi:membrane protease YdiL (CAAX protease family)
MRRMAAALALFYLGMFAGAWAQKLAGPPRHSVAQLIIAALSFQGAALVLITRLLHEHETSWGEAFGFTIGWRRALLIGVVAAALFLPLGLELQRLSALFLLHFSQLGIRPEPQQAVQTLQAATGVADRIVLGIITILLAPLAEESLFRGILYTWIKNAGFPQLALWGTSVFFALVHMNIVTFLPLFVLALLLVWLYERTGNLLASMATHGLFNGLNFAMLYLLEKRSG